MRVVRARHPSSATTAGPRSRRRLLVAPRVSSSALSSARSSPSKLSGTIVDLRGARCSQSLRPAPIARGEDRVDVAAASFAGRSVKKPPKRAPRREPRCPSCRRCGCEGSRSPRPNWQPTSSTGPRAATASYEKLLSVAREGGFVCGLRSLVEGARLRRVGSDERQRRQRDDRFFVAQRAAEAVGHRDPVLAHGLQLLARFVAHLRVGHGDDRDLAFGRVVHELREKLVALARQGRRGIFVGEDPLLAMLVRKSGGDE